MAKWEDGVTTGLEMARGFNALAANGGHAMLMAQAVNAYLDAGLTALAATTIAGVANTLQMVPFFAGRTFSIDRMGVAVSTFVASAQGKCFIYEADANGRPSKLVLAPSDNLDFSGTNAFREHTLSTPFTFEAGKLYWIGLRHSSTAAVRSIPLGALRSLGPDSANGTNMRTHIQKTLAYGNALPDPWVFNALEMVGGTPPSVRFRVSAT